MYRLTGSALDRAEACPASAVLPAAYSPSSTAADEGTAIHRYLETGELPEAFKARCEAIDMARAVPLTSGIDMRETAFAFDCRTWDVRKIHLTGPREYGALLHSEVALTIDRAWRDEGGMLHVDDYKTGVDAPEAEGLLQLEAAAVCVAGYLGVDRIAAAIVHIGQDGRVWRDEVVLDIFDLQAASERIASVWRAVQAGPTDVSTGNHCKYCPALTACPAHAGIVKRFADIDADLLTIEDVGRAWEQLQAAQQWLAKVEQAIKLRIDREGSAPLPSGGCVRPVEVQRASVVADAAWPVLTELGIDPSKIAETRLGIGDVEKAAKAIGVKDVRARLMAADALKMSSSTSYRRAK
jgi:hypothetical protein